MSTTKLANLVNPQVMGDLVQKKLIDNIRLGAIADIDTTLVGVPGNTLTLPSYSYIGSAVSLAEGSSISYVSLNASTVSVSVAKLVQGVEITDEAVLAGYGDPLAEATDQIAKALADKVEYDFVAVLHAITGTMLYETSTSSTAVKDTDIIPALEKFGEDIDGVNIALVSPAIYTQMRANSNNWIPASEMAAGVAVKGVVGEYGGCQVIVSNRLTTNAEIYIVKPGAIRLIMKRAALIEAQRNMDNFTTKIAGSQHTACYLYDASKAIRIAKKSA